MKRGVLSCITLAGLAIPLVVIPLILSSHSVNEICGIHRGDFLAGNFNPASVHCFESVNDAGISVDNRRHYLHRETLEALEKLYTAFKEEHPDIHFYIRSSTRNYQHQRGIWERKWRQLDRKDRSDYDISAEIMRYSAMPGTSRHHWGTDFDINELNNSYYEKGDGRIIFQWMKKNASDFGFCMPYTPDRDTGYAEERWHWSYKPLASRYLVLWNQEYQNNSSFFFSGRDFTGRKYAEEKSHEFVNAINPECI